ncbi:protein translocase subunit SecDF [Oceanobacillus profundus]|uniref:Multifunctional fusion protein n=1 Tax=Oceanobacillus profundus TaxID=372463 RepID=A0A417YJA5_9BACI|nr:protein translocase subunit SecDF [Oceanobacillus profundus]MBR3118384.1 protein translocase subunit SecDF [Oceanobacillus sp.]MDO6448253.1 protein translocase subunit SecDF [Oceanobacillus profundus]PAE31006.1 protein translocase subunit SecDF [Paenibacillus sp. 7884-2]RHW33060.1 protein translocase subunit SecDF [Oceanobacillus profundus]
MKKRGRIVAFFLVVIALAVTIGTTVPGITKNINLGLDLQGGFEVLYEVEPVDSSQEVTRGLMEGTVQTLNDRVNRLGISEAVIDIEGEDRIRVQLAGIENQSEARDMLSTSAQLSFRDVNDQELLDGTDVKEGSAKQDFDPNTNAPIVTLELKDAAKFGEVTTQISQMNIPDNKLVIWMDFQEGDSYEEEASKSEPKFVSAPNVSEPLHTTNVMISGDFTVESAKQLADIINSGSLPVHMTEIFSTSVGAQFGEQALNQMIFAGAIGIGLIVLFMLVFYRFSGFIATINLAFYIYLVILVFQLLNGVLTLSGIAALILGVGMAVDANVITFERIKEELRIGKSVKAAFKAGNKSSFMTILDANLTTIIAAVVLFIFGTSSVKGFATMLIISILISFLTAVLGTRILLGLWVQSGFLTKRKTWFGVKKDQIRDIAEEEKEPRLFNRKVNFVQHRNKFFIGTSVLVILGAISILIFQINPGIDFTSGSRVEVVSESSLTAEEVESGFEELGHEVKSIVLSGENSELAVARFDGVLSDTEVEEVRVYFNERYGHEPSVSVVSPIVGQELVKNAIYAVGIAAIFMIIYVTFRFEFFFAITALLTLLHDVFFMLAIFSVAQIEFDITIVAAILTIVGYSINNTIVIFDRIRENIRKKKRVKSFKELTTIVNTSIIQSFTRTMNTSITTIVAVIAFLILGASSITSFAFALTIGLVAGTYSSLLLASQLWLVWRGKSVKEKPLDFTKKKAAEGPQV